jgi:hypothetical protein
MSKMTIIHANEAYRLARRASEDRTNKMLELVYSEIAKAAKAGMGHTYVIIPTGEMNELAQHILFSRLSNDGYSYKLSGASNLRVSWLVKLEFQFTS